MNGHLLAAGNLPDLASGLTIVGVGDYNGDGKSDIMLKAADGTISIDFMNGLSVSSNGVVGNTTAGTYNTQLIGLLLPAVQYMEANGNLHSLQFDPQQASVVASNTLSGPTPGTQTIIVGDLNGDGEQDLISQSYNGTVSGRLTDGTQVIGGGVIASVPGWTLLASADFNNDKKSDLLLSRADGTLGIWDMNGTTLVASALVGNVAINKIPTGWRFLATGDFNGDGKADLLFEETDQFNPQLHIWQMDNANITANVDIGAPQYGIDSLVAVGDFNGDHKSDLLFESSRGDLQMYEMNGTTIAQASIVNIGSAGVNGEVPTGWKIVGTTDYNGDGKSDLLLKDTNGNLICWLMDGFNVVAGGGLLGTIGTNASLINSSNHGVKAASHDFNGDGVSDVLLTAGGAFIDWIVQNGLAIAGNFLGGGLTGWTAVGAGDFNGDGVSDILLQSGGTIVEWTMSNGSVASGGLVGFAPGFTVAGTGDFNGDGTTDLVLQAGGTFVDWIVQNGGATSGNFLGGGLTGWSIVGTGDFNGDGTTDILLQNGGSVVAWDMQNGAVSNGAVTGFAPGFTVVGAGDFNADGTTDILLQSGGTFVDWIVQNNVATAGYLLGSGLTGWSVANVGDYNGDGGSDILLKIGSTVVDWQMGGVGIVVAGKVLGDAGAFNIAV